MEHLNKVQQLSGCKGSCSVTSALAKDSSNASRITLSSSCCPFLLDLGSGFHIIIIR